MRFFYTLVFYAAIPFILLRLWWRAIAAPAYAKRWAERFGFFAPLVTSKTVIWLHAVSVGEFMAALPLIRELQQREDIQLVVTTTTPTGSERVRAHCKDHVFHVYAPYDLPDVLIRFFSRIKPSALLIMETELWPNLLAFAKRKGIPSILINARMSARSARGYQRFSALTQPMLQNLTCALVQSSQDADRLIALGLPRNNCLVTGNIKFDLILSDELRLQADALKKQWSSNGNYFIWIAASTHAGEDELILDAFASCLHHSPTRKMRLVLVPRHPERFNQVAALCESRGYTISRRSNQNLAENTQIILGDTMGELLLFFGASDVAFLGGSLVPNGGHNFIEPAAWALPLISGTHLFNFAEMSRLLIDAGALVTVPDATALAHEVNYLQSSEINRRQRGQAAKKVADENRGALQKTVASIIQHIHI